jgi:hypothetical protein
MTRVSDNFFKLTTDIGDGYILRRDGDIVGGISTQELSSISRIYYETNWSFTDWYIDGYIGDDNNDGISENTPLASLEELSIRLAVSIPINHTITVHVAQGIYKKLYIQLNQYGTAQFYTYGQPTIVDSLIVGTYTVYSHSTATGCLLSVPDIDFSEFVGYRLRRLSDSSISWILIANPDDLGTSVCQITKPTLPPNSGGKSWDPGDSLVIEFLPQIESVSIKNTAKESNSNILVSLNDLHITKQIFINHNSYYINGCRISGKITTIINILTYWIGVLFTFLEYPNDFNGYAANCGIYPGITTYPEFVNIGFKIRSGYMLSCTFIRTRLTINSNADAVIINNCQFFEEADNEAISLSNGSSLLLSNGISGKRNTAGLRVRRGGNSHIQYSDGLIFNLQTTLDVILLVYTDFNISLDGDPMIAWNSIKEWRDGGQSGVVVIGTEGFVDVFLSTIWKPAFQRLFLSTYTNNGLGSIASAPLSLRTSTGFRILGTSGDIVDWYIPALGYGIFISKKIDQ